ncbi:MAG: hypothetical protein ACO1QS_00120 [Verrucomicrobiota bacterium]
MKLDDAQKKTVIGWIEQGLKLAEIQKKLGTDMGLNPTYMEVRFLVDDLKVLPKDPEPPKKAETVPTAKAAGTVGEEDFAEEAPDAPAPTAPAPGGAGNVSVTLDQITRPGAMISGKVTFSDGNTAEWYLDQMGRLGVVPAVKGYKPSQEDVQAFQMELQRQLQKMGF